MADMEIETEDDILRKASVDGSMDYSSWPALLPIVITRIEKIAHHEFPIPHIPPPQPLARPPSPRFLAPLPSSDPIDAPSSSDTTPSSQETNKENANPSPVHSHSGRAGAINTSLSSSTLLPSSSPLQAHAALPLLQPPAPLDEQQLPELHPPAGTAPTLPTPVIALLNEVTSTLALNFAQYPPHTIQRLAELVLRPRQQYRSLIAYLHALDRVVHVTSGANVYPLPPAIPDLSAMTLLANGASAGAGGGLTINTAAANNIGSDEALGGALLTPIPWLARRVNGGGGGVGGGSSEDGSSDAGSGSPLSSGSSSGGGSVGPAPLPQQQQQVQQSQPQQTQAQPQTSQQPQAQNRPATSSGNNSPSSTSNGRKLEGQVRTESTETIEGPNGMGSIETVSVSVNGIPSMGAGAVLAQRGVTQGELLRQEQRAGVVPMSQLARHGQQQQPHGQTSTTAAADEDAAMSEDGIDYPNGDEAHDGDSEDEIPHARGPEEIGAADMGPQPASTSDYVVGPDGTAEMRGIDVEAAVGRPSIQPRSPPTLTVGVTRGDGAEGAVPRSPKREAADEIESAASKKRVKEEEEKELELKRDAEGDVAIGDPVPGVSEAEPVVQEKEEEEGEEDKKMAGTDGGDDSGGRTEGEGGLKEVKSV
ncbi:hypothetical protein B0T25DRAFT_523034 [Lasiosphaeria hispida]|uniref:Protein phosphatase 4 core regulatory subunit R2 n=1 Tax=Lasiosphaeria hispida TaxID=260671 RepID=A0AAJ0M8G7_9PEZI|nr:hypothetical protein B0T25DRAFT_523034 [Lasiosphaeria hispida]